MRNRIIATVLIVVCVGLLCWGSHWTTDVDVLTWDAIPKVTIEGPCYHDKLKAPTDPSIWGYVMHMQDCPDEYRMRKYKCAKCKRDILVLHMLVMPETEKCMKIHLADFTFDDDRVSHYDATVDINDSLQRTWRLQRDGDR